MICPYCNGKGKTTYFAETARDENSVTFSKRENICQTCNGSGEKPTTNADRIRAMSDEELAAFVAEKIVNLENQKMIEQGHTPTATQLSALGHTMYCTLMMWLRQPAEGE